MFTCKDVNYKKGTTNDNVKELQTILKEKGLYTGKINGIYGDITTSSVKLLQRQLGLSQTGTFDEATCKAFHKWIGTGLDCSNINLEYQSKGDDVTTLQTVMTNMGVYSGKINGLYGRITEASVKALQKEYGLTVDGVFGSKTCNALNKAYNTGTTTNTTTTTTSTNSTNCVGRKFMKNALLAAAETYRKHIKNNNNYPNYIEIKDSNGTTYNVARSYYMALFESMNMFAIKNGRLPNYVTCDSTSNNPLCIDYQNNGYNCGPTSLSMCLQMYADYVSEATLAKAAGTTTSGTGPSQLISTAKKYGYTMAAIERNSTAVKNSLDKCRPVLMHIRTSVSGGKSCLGYRGDYGHYIMCYGMSNGKYLIADPTKGFKTCTPSGIDNAKTSSNQKYYSISIA